MGKNRMPNGCRYVADVLRLAALGLIPAGSSNIVRVDHDLWRPLIGGACDRPCRPDIFLNGERVIIPSGDIVA